MKKQLIAAAFGLLLALPALAADNITITQGSGTTLKTKDVGAGVEESQVLLSDATGLSILGVAGTANSNVITIQGIASGTVVPTSAAQSGTWNITNVSGTVSLPTGAATSANQTTGNTNTGNTATALGAPGDSVCGTATGTCSLAALIKFLNQAASGAIPAGSNTIGTVNLGTAADPCVNNAKSYADFESTTSGGSIIAAVSAKKTYVCSISIVTSAAANVSIIEGTGSSVCTGGTPSGDFLNTGTTAANGAAFAANGGIQAGNGGNTIFANATANQNTCVAFTTTNTPQVNVHVAYVQQ